MPVDSALRVIVLVIVLAKLRNKPEVKNQDGARSVITWGLPRYSPSRHQRLVLPQTHFWACGKVQLRKFGISSVQ